MPRFLALNERCVEEEHSDAASPSDKTIGKDTSKLTKEAEEALVREKYWEAMTNLSSGRKGPAKAELEELLEWSILKEVDAAPDAKDFGALGQVLYAVYKNLGIILSEEGDHEQSVQMFLKAVRIDDTEALLWHKLGLQAVKIEDYSLGSYSFEKCLEINPTFWPSVDNVISIQYILGDYLGCLSHIERALEIQEDYLRGLVLKDEIFRQNPYMKEFTRDSFAKYDGRNYDKIRGNEILAKLNACVEKVIEKSRPAPLQPVSPDVDLPDLSLSSIGRALCDLYGRLKNLGQLIHPVDLTRWIEQTKTALNAPTEEDLIDDVEVTIDDSDEPVIMEAQEPMNENDSPVLTDTVGDSDVELIRVVKNVQIMDDSDSQSLLQQRRPAVSPAFSEGNMRKGWKRKRDSKGIDVFKRRSTRLIPGFQMEDPEAFGPLTTKPMTICEHLRSYLPSLVLENGDQARDPDAAGTTTNVDMEGENTDRAPLLDDTFTKLDALSFLEENHRLDVVQILFEYLQLLQQRECHFRWTDSLRTVYMECYEYWTVHSQYVIPTENTDLPMKLQCCREAAVRLLYAECLAQKGIDELVLLKICTYLRHFTAFGSVFENDQERTKFHFRLDLLNALIQENKKNFGGANWYLQCCLDALEDGLPGGILPLEHCDLVVSESMLRHRMEKMERAGLLDQVEELFVRKEYQSVVEILSPVLRDTTIDYDEIGLDRIRQYQILLSCYRNLDQSADTSSTLTEALKSSVSVYNRLDTKDRKQWWSIMGDILIIGEWAFTGHNVIISLGSLDPFQRCCLANALVEIIGLANECPLEKEKVPESCWLSPWLILYEINHRLEMAEFTVSYATNWYEKASNSTVVLATRSLMILWRCHEELGRRRLCMIRNGSFLIYLVEEILRVLRDPVVSSSIPSSCVNDTLNCAEQCFYCLYKYPPKKKRHLEEHDATPIELNWRRAQLLFDFLKPDQPPEFDDHPNTTAISADAAQLLHKIESLIPVMLRPNPFARQLDDFFENCTTEDFPQLELSNEPIISDLFHLLADYYLKTQDFEKAVQFYQFDLCVCADRFDSWAGLAMARGYLLDTRLRSMELKYDFDSWAVISREAKAALYCYEKATSLRDTHYVLLVEYGSMAYALHSFFSRSLKHVGSKQTKNMKWKLARARDRYLAKADRALKKADTVVGVPSDEQKEEWVHNYLLGKIEEKRQSNKQDPTMALRRYHAASYHLHKDGARYPERIKYTPQRYSLETLEVFYRVHACALKWIIRGNVTVEVMKKVIHYLELFRGSPLYDVRTAGRSVNSARLLSDPEVVDSLDSLLAQVEIPTLEDDHLDTDAALDLSPGANTVSGMSKMRTQLISWCSEAFQLCWKRFPNHFKSHYWLAMMYSCLDELKDHGKSRQLLLGPVNIPECQVNVGLFQQRKPSNYFESTWRIPVDDISRAGSFAEHIFRSVKLLISVLENLRDYKQLCELVIALHRKPSADKHKYLREADREELLETASSVAEQTLKQAGERDRDDVLVAAYRIYLALYKMQCGNKGRWAELLKTIMAEGLEKDANELDLPTVLSLCQELGRQQRELAKPVVESIHRPRTDQLGIQRVKPIAHVQSGKPQPVRSTSVNEMGPSTSFQTDNTGTSPRRVEPAVVSTSAKPVTVTVSAKLLARTFNPGKTTAVRSFGAPLDLSSKCVDLTRTAGGPGLQSSSGRVQISSGIDALVSAGVGVHTSGLGVHTSGGGVHTSGFGVHTSGVGVHTSGGGVRTSGGGVHTSGVGIRTSGSGTHSSSGGIRSSSGGCVKSSGGTHSSRSSGIQSAGGGVQLSNAVGIRSSVNVPAPRRYSIDGTDDSFSPTITSTPVASGELLQRFIASFASSSNLASTSGSSLDPYAAELLRCCFAQLPTFPVNQISSTARFTAPSRPSTSVNEYRPRLSRTLSGTAGGNNARNLSIQSPRQVRSTTSARPPHVTGPGQATTYSRPAIDGRRASPMVTNARQQMNPGRGGAARYHPYRQPFPPYPH